MRQARFLFLVDRYGPDRDVWPVRARARAERLLATSAAARAAMSESKRLDNVLKTLAIDVDDDAVARIMASIPHIVRRRRNRLEVTLDSWGLLPLWPRLGFLVTALALGLIIGLIQAGRADVRGRDNPPLGALVSLADPIQEFFGR